MFYIGQEVICIDDREGNFSHEKHLKKGKTYIVREVMISPITNILQLWIEEAGHGWWHAKRFVPIDYTQNKQVTYKEVVEEVPVFSN